MSEHTGYSVRSGVVDEVTLDGYTMTHFEAAEIVDNDGCRAAVFLEPAERSEPGWDEAAFRSRVRAVARELAYENGHAESWTLVFDPARDQQEEEPLDA